MRREHDVGMRGRDGRVKDRTQEVTSVGHGNPVLEHDPEKWIPVFPRDKRGTRLRGDHAQIKETERDDVSKKSHPTLVNELAADDVAEQLPAPVLELHQLQLLDRLEV